MNVGLGRPKMEGCLTMKKPTKLISSMLVLGGLIMTGVTTFAATEAENNAINPVSQTTFLEGTRTRGSMKKGQRGHNNMEGSHLTEEQQTERIEQKKERLGEQLKEGNITQEQHDEALTAILEGKKPALFGGGHFRNVEGSHLTEEQQAERTEQRKERLAEQLKEGNITQEQYNEAVAAVAEGKTPHVLGKSKGQRSFCKREKSKFTEN